MLDELKLISKSQAELSRNLRKLERSRRASAKWNRDRQKDPSQDEVRADNLHWQRTHIQRKKSRELHLLRGYLKGTPYRCIEDPKRTRKPIYDIDLVICFMLNFGSKALEELLPDFGSWLTDYEES